MGDMPSYTKAESEAIRAKRDEVDRMLAEATVGDLSDLPAEKKLPPLVSLIETLESAIKIAYGKLCLGHPEPFPGACEGVLKQSMLAIQLSRANNLLPQRTDKED